MKVHHENASRSLQTEKGYRGLLRISFDYLSAVTPITRPRREFGWT